jgi:hypothetical protein
VEVAEAVLIVVVRVLNLPEAVALAVVVTVDQNTILLVLQRVLMVLGVVGVGVVFITHIILQVVLRVVVAQLQFGGGSNNGALC